MEKKRVNRISGRILVNRIFSIAVFLCNIFALYTIKQSFVDGNINKGYGFAFIVLVVLIDYLFYIIIKNYSQEKKKARRLKKRG